MDIITFEKCPRFAHLESSTIQVAYKVLPADAINTESSIIKSCSKMKPCMERLSILISVVLLCATQSYAQLSFRQRPWQRRARQYQQRGYSSQGQQQQQQQQQSYSSSGPTQAAVREYESHFLDDDNWMTDKRSRLWDVQLKQRKPNRYSLTSRLILANVVAFAVQSYNPAFTQWGVKISDKILRGEELYRLISPVFLHGSIIHLFSNMYSLNNVGVTTEQMFGSGRFLVSYFVAGAAGNLLSAMQSPNPALGASGAVFGVMASFYVFLNRHDWLLGRAGRGYSDAITQTLFINLVIGAMNPMVDNWGHLGGAVGGAAMAYYFGPRLYLTKLPEGGQMIVDRPIIRLPRNIESIPEKVFTRTKRMLRRMQVWRHTGDLSEKPWRPKTSPRKNYQQRQGSPNRSIKPKL